MALIDSSARSAHTAAANAVAGPPAIITQVVDFVKKQFGADAWTFFHDHQKDVLYTLNVDKKVLFFNVHLSHDFNVSDARPLFEKLFGPEPSPVTTSAPVT